MKNYTYVKEEEKQEWIKLSKLLSTPEIAKLSNRNYKTVNRYFKELKLPLRKNSVRKISNETFLREYNKFIEDKKETLKAFSKRIGLTMNMVRTKAKKHGLKNIGFAHKHKNINDDFFSNIDTEIKAYLLGFFAADGHIEKRKDYYTYCLKIGIHKKDIEILELYNEYVANNLCKISFPKTKPNMAIFAIHSTKIGEDLLKLGYNNRKTYTTNSIPNIPEHLIKHFIRGYFDGDGSVMVNKRERGYNRYVTFTSYEVGILKEIFSKFNLSQNKIYTECKKNVGRTVKGIKTVFSACCTMTIKDCVNFRLIYHYLYDDAVFFLKRKYDKFTLGISTMDDSYTRNGIEKLGNIGEG